MRTIGTVNNYMHGINVEMTDCTCVALLSRQIFTVFDKQATTKVIGVILGRSGGLKWIQTY